MIDEIKIFNKAIDSYLDNSIKIKNLRLKKIFFLRNEQVENFAEKINNYSVLSKLKFKFFFSGYSNNLPISNKRYDLSIIWIDYTSYEINENFFNWINSKADELSKFCDYVLIKPILNPKYKTKEIKKLNLEYKRCFKNPKIIFIDIVDELLEDFKNYWDLKRSDFFGTKTSLQGQNLQSKLLGLKILPSLFDQKIKSIIFDLDDTLYTGVVGEDGISKIYLDQNQTKAHKLYSLMNKNGTLLSICSKNNLKDVREIFKKKILQKRLFFPIKASWDLKSDNVREIQKILKVSFNNMLFIDNNISEIMEVKKNFPEIRVFWSPTSKSFLNCLKFFPNLTEYFNSNTSEINKKRVIDLKASIKREKIIRESKNNNHLAILKMKLDYRLNNNDEFDRIFSLTNKVNQFIFSYKRFTKQKIKEYFEKKNKFIFTVSLKDKFSDSGNVGVIFFSRNGEDIYLDEICVSCRALGRNLEDYFIFFPLQILCKKFKFKNFYLQFTDGPKNSPAKKYFDKLQKKFLKVKKIKKNLQIPISQLNKLSLKNKGVSLTFKN